MAADDGPRVQDILDDRGVWPVIGHPSKWRAVSAFGPASEHAWARPRRQGRIEARRRARGAYPSAPWMATPMSLSATLRREARGQPARPFVIDFQGDAELPFGPATPPPESQWVAASAKRDAAPGAAWRRDVAAIRAQRRDADAAVKAWYALQLEADGAAKATRESPYPPPPQAAATTRVERRRRWRLARTKKTDLDLEREHAARASEHEARNFDAWRPDGCGDLGYDAAAGPAGRRRAVAKRKVSASSPGAGAAFSARATALRARRKQREMGDAALARARMEVRKEAIAKDLVMEFFPGGASVTPTPHRGSALLRSLLADLSLDVSAYRAPSTWKKYLRPWRTAWAWMLAQMEIIHAGHANVQFCVELLATHHRAVAYAYAKLVEKSKPLSALITACTAINFACKLNGQDAIMNDFAVSMLKTVARRQQGKPAQAKAALLREEQVAIVDGWGWGVGGKGVDPLSTAAGVTPSPCPARRQVALFVAVACATLGRFSDVSRMVASNILFFPEGVMFCIPIRKNVQEGERHCWVPMAESHRVGASGRYVSGVALLRAHLGYLGYVVPEPSPEGARLGAGSSAGLDRYIFRDIRHRRASDGDAGLHLHFDDNPHSPKVGPTHKGQIARWQLVLGDGERRMSKTTYDKTLALLREALRDCCGVERDSLGEFGTHSCRRGGDTEMFKAGASAETRQLIGMWMTPSVELGYVGFSARQHMLWASGHVV